MDKVIASGFAELAGKMSGRPPWRLRVSAVLPRDPAANHTNLKGMTGVFEPNGAAGGPFSEGLGARVCVGPGSLKAGKGTKVKISAKY